MAENKALTLRTQRLLPQLQLNPRLHKTLPNLTNLRLRSFHLILLLPRHSLSRCWYPRFLTHAIVYIQAGIQRKKEDERRSIAPQMGRLGLDG